MFYSDRMKLSEEVALTLCKAVIQSCSMFGGALTINWHTRSLSPERLWGNFYAELLREVQKHRVWFGDASNMVLADGCLKIAVQGAPVYQCGPSWLKPQQSDQGPYYQVVPPPTAP